MWKTRITELLQINYPIIQAPMAGGPTTSELAAAVSNAGGLGTIGAGYMNPEQIRKQIREIRDLTDKPFGINLFVPSSYKANQEELEIGIRHAREMASKLGKSFDYADLPDYKGDFEVFNEQLQVVKEEGVAVCSFTFGLPSKESIQDLKGLGIIVMGTATTVDEAILNEEAGMDAVTMQGSEAGGHRGTFTMGVPESLIGSMALIPQASDSVQLPVIAAGGIMDGRGLLAARILGAEGVQMGTAFLTTQESGAQQVYKEKLLSSTETQSVLTRSFSGKLARGIENEFIRRSRDLEDSLPPYPIQNSLTKGIRKLAGEQKNPEYLSLWSGQSVRLARNLTASELMGRIIKEAEKAANLIK